MILIDAGKLYRKLAEDIFPLTNDRHCLKQDVVDAIIDAPTIEQPTWISCEERLPTEGVSIEMFFPVSLSICLGYYKEIKKIPFWCVKFPDGTGRVGDEKPTHWRYRYIVDAPQPPEGVE